MCFRESSSVCSHLMRCFDSITVWEKVEEVPWRTYPGRQSCALTQRHSLPLDYEALICSPSATTGPSYWSIAPNCREWTQTLKWFNSKHLLFCVNRCVTSNKQNRHSISAKTLPADCEAWRRRGDELGLIYSHRTWAPWSHWIMYEILCPISDTKFSWNWITWQDKWPRAQQWWPFQTPDFLLVKMVPQPNVSWTYQVNWTGRFHAVRQGWAPPGLVGRCPASFRSHPGSTHLNDMIATSRRVDEVI